MPFDLAAAHDLLGLPPAQDAPIPPVPMPTRQVVDALRASFRALPPGVLRPAPQPLFGEASLSPELTFSGAPVGPPELRAPRGYQLPSEQLTPEARTAIDQERGLDQAYNMVLSSLGGDVAAPSALERAILGTQGGEGFTLTHTGRPFSGTAFLVAEPKLTQTLDALTPENVRAFLGRQDVQGALESGGLIGGWRNPETGQLEINVTRPHAGLETAVPHAQAGGQQSIGHLSNGAYNEIPTPPNAGQIDRSGFIRAAHDILGLTPPEPAAAAPSAPARIEPTPGAAFHANTQPFESMQLKKPLAAHSEADLAEMENRTRMKLLSAQETIQQGGIGSTRPFEYDLQVLADERARRAASLPKAPQNADAGLWDVAQRVRQQAGLTHERMPEVSAVNPEAGKYMAETYTRLRSDPNDPLVRRAYGAFIKETDAQMAALRDAGYTFDFVDHDPYKSSKEMLADLRDNKHLSVYKTKPGEGHPLMTPEQNDVFRAVHDAMGHGIHGYQFGPKGEENAFRAHSFLYSPEARRALATETRGQNSWYNFGPESHKPVGQRPFAEQKAALWPTSQMGEYDRVLGRQPAPRSAPAGERVYHGTTAEGFSIPSIPSDLGVHVGTPGQAAERLSYFGPDDGPMRSINDVKEGGRILPLTSTASNPAKLTRDLGNWHPADLLSQLVTDKVLTKDEAKSLLPKVMTETNATSGSLATPKSPEAKAAYTAIREKLQQKGYDSITYPNKYEPSSWGKSMQGDYPIHEPSTIVLDPAKHLRNALVTGPSEPFVPPGQPRVLGGRLPNDEIRPLALDALAMSSSHIGGPYVDVATMKNLYPAYAPYLDHPEVQHELEKVAKRYRTFMSGLQSFEDVSRLAHAPEGQAIRHWYRGWLPEVQKALPPDAAEMLTRFSAILSAQKSPKDEMGMALAALDRWAHGEPINTNGYQATTKFREHQLALAAADQRWGQDALKTSDYYLARKGFQQTGALDRHVIRAYTGNEKVTRAQYPALWARVRADAQRAGMSVDEWQAAVWGGQTKYKAAPGAAGATPEAWLRHHLASGEFDRLLEKFPGLQALAERGALESGH